jgi:FkbM family methyltransferase
MWKEFTRRCKRIRNGQAVKDKLRLLEVAFFRSFPAILRRHLPTVDKAITRITDKLCRNVTVVIDDMKYQLIDYESLTIVSHEHYEMAFMPLWLKPRKGEVLIDIGAHIGKYTLTAAKAVTEKGLVVAVEPHSTNYQTLQKNIQINGLTNVKTLNIAAWNTSTKLNLYTVAENKASMYSTKITRPDYLEVNAQTMDSALKELYLPRLDWIKIDVEGAEVEALQGLDETITQYTPKLIVEVLQVNLNEIRKILKKHDYSLIRITPWFIFYGYIFCTPTPEETPS